MQGKHLTQKERFYIEKRRGEGVKPATIARELDLPRSAISRELRRNTDPAFNGVYPAGERIRWHGNGVINPCQKMLFTGWSHTFRTSSGRSFPPIPLLKTSVAACSWNSMSLSARIRLSLYPTGATGWRRAVSATSSPGKTLQLQCREPQTTPYSQPRWH
ncbi:hypothetical protein EWM60_15305 [Candidatus Erwinia dacicola]|nr:hypothetical protein [Candidatus Erwinia dacicola]